MIIGSEHLGNQHAYGLRALRREIGEIYSHQLPSDIGGILPFENVDAFDHRIVREYQRLSAKIDDGGIVF